MTQIKFKIAGLEKSSCKLDGAAKQIMSIKQIIAATGLFVLCFLIGVVLPVNGYSPLHWADVSNMSPIVSQLQNMGVAD